LFSELAAQETPQNETTPIGIHPLRIKNLRVQQKGLLGRRRCDQIKGERKMTLLPTDYKLLA